jgi:antitoxin component of RelBE/YafQ-DinJ toxin-antitoxin module
MEKTGLIQLRVTPELKEAIVKRAKELNMTLSAYIVYLAQKDLKKLK